MNNYFDHECANKIKGILGDLISLAEIDRVPAIINVDGILEKNQVKYEEIHFLLTYFLQSSLLILKDKHTIIIPSKNSYLALKAIVTSINLNICVLDDVREEDKKCFFTNFTNNLEHIRRDLRGDLTPIHDREMVNIVIKGKQIRRGRLVDVYLHEFHPEWKEYHLIGWGRRNESNIDELVSKVMHEKLQIDPHEYAISNHRIDPIEYVSISKSHGALTKYTLNVRIIESMKFDLNIKLKSLLRNSNGSSAPKYNWFSLPEINQRGDGNFVIMESTQRLFEKLQKFNIPLIVKRAKRLYYPPLIQIKTDLPNRIILRQLLIFLNIALIILLIYICKPFIINGLSVQRPFLDNLNNLSGVATLIIEILVLFLGFKSST